MAASLPIALVLHDDDLVLVDDSSLTEPKIFYIPAVYHVLRVGDCWHAVRRIPCNRIESRLLVTLIGPASSQCSFFVAYITQGTGARRMLR